MHKEMKPCVYGSNQIFIKYGQVMGLGPSRGCNAEPPPPGGAIGHHAARLAENRRPKAAKKYKSGKEQQRH